MNKALKDLGLRTKLFLLLTISTLLALVLACTAFVIHDREAHRDSVTQRLRHEVGIVAEYGAASLEFDDPESMAPLLQAVGHDAHVMATLVCRQDGSIFIEQIRPDARAGFDYPELPGNYTETGDGTVAVALKVVHRGKELGGVYMLRDLTDVRARTVQMVQIALLVLGACFFFALLLSLRLQHLVADPIIQLSLLANRVARKKDFHLRAKRATDDEIGQLMDDFNEMLSEIETRDEALQKAKDELEVRVRERTEQLRRSQQKLVLQVRQSPVGIIDWNVKGQVTEWNPAAEKIFGWTAFEATGRTYKEILESGTGSLGARSIWKVITEGVGDAHGIARCRTKNRGSIICEWFNTAIVDEDGKPVGVVSLVLDVTQRVQAEERFSKVFQASPAPVLILDQAEGRIIDVNESFLKDFGRDRDDVFGKVASEIGLWQVPDEQKRLFDLLQHKPSVRNYECLMLAADLKTREALLSAELITLNGRNCILLQIEDLTERMSLEMQLRQAQKMEGIGQLAAGVAHDFNNILTVIEGHAELLMGQHSEGDPDHESLVEIDRAARRAADLTRQLLAFSRKQVMQTRLVNLTDILANSSKMLQRMVGETVEVAHETTPRPMLLRADVGMLEQVLLNLCVNARDAMPDGGRITIKTSQVKIDVDAAEGDPEAMAGDFICLSVSDMGRGMDPQTKARIFEPFFTTKGVGEGTGLGLATVYGIVKQHKGWLRMESEVAKGTTFYIYLPRTKTAEAETTMMKRREPVSGGSEGVLVVEDEAPLRLMIVMALKKMGYRVFEAEHGVAALEVWREHRERIHLLLTDMVMPKGLSGWELAEQLMAEREGLKVIYTSGYSPDLFGKDVQLDENVNFLPKPYQTAELTRLVRHALDASASAQSGG